MLLSWGRTGLQGRPAGAGAYSLGEGGPVAPVIPDFSDVVTVDTSVVLPRAAAT